MGMQHFSPSPRLLEPACTFPGDDPFLGRYEGVAADSGYLALAPHIALAAGAYGLELTAEDEESARRALMWASHADTALDAPGLKAPRYAASQGIVDAVFGKEPLPEADVSDVSDLTVAGYLLHNALQDVPAGHLRRTAYAAAEVRAQQADAGTRRGHAFSTYGRGVRTAELVAGVAVANIEASCAQTERAVADFVGYCGRVGGLMMLAGSAVDLRADNANGLVSIPASLRTRALLLGGAATELVASLANTPQRRAWFAALGLRTPKPANN
ncbi:MAG TPA: hypothetical protein VLH84_01225 [Patescibacteria group bacterium]|nr:hypothetical protein [Patescibacteria group bacterium]